MSPPARFARRARAEIAHALEYYDESPNAQRRLRSALADAARKIGRHPALGRREPTLADDRYRFWSLGGFPYLLVYRPSTAPPSIVRVVHMARDLPTLLADLGQASDDEPPLAEEPDEDLPAA